MLGLPPDFAVGLILVACAPGGTASNVVTYIARANVALSVVMTSCSTLAAVVVTPWLTQFLAGAYLPVDGWGMFLTTLQVVLGPVALGVFLNRRLPRVAASFVSWGPLVSGSGSRGRDAARVRIFSRLGGGMGAWVQAARGAGDFYRGRHAEFGVGGGFG
jgi:predicted Na+-dependent transporter